MVRITDHQRRFFETFGYLTFPGALRAEVGWITDEFEAVFAARSVGHDGTERSTVVPFIDQTERLAALLDHRVLLAIVGGLLGEDFNYVGGDGNYYTGDTAWHSDGLHPGGGYLKIALYLDPVGPDTGALRVIPGSHLPGLFAWEGRRAADSATLWGIPQGAVPCAALSSEPGDVVVFDHNILHASVGGGSARRMFTLNLARRARTDDEIRELRRYINSHSRFQIDHVHSELMSSGPPARQRHLEQVREHEGRLAQYSAELRNKGVPVARG